MANLPINLLIICNPMSSATYSHAGVRVRDFYQGKWCLLEWLVRKYATDLTHLLFKSQFGKCLHCVLEAQAENSWRGDQDPAAESTSTAFGGTSGQQSDTRSLFEVQLCTQNTLLYKVGIVCYVLYNFFLLELSYQLRCPSD